MTDALNVLQLGQPLQVARCLGRAPNVKVHVLASSEDPWPVVRFSRYVSSFHLYHGEGDDGVTGDEAISAVLGTVKRTGAKVILPAGKSPIQFISTHRDVLSQFVAVPPSPVLDALDVVSDKWLLANLLEQHKLRHPPTILCTGDEAFERGLRDLSFPVLLKPRQDLRDGRGIRLFASVEELQLFLEENPEHLGTSIVQGYVRGHDTGCNVLCDGGEILAYTIQKAYVPARRPYSPAAVITFVEDERVLDLVTGLVSALGWSGVANIDLRYDEENDQFGVLEFNPRYWASLSGSLSAGVNFPYLHCLAGLGIPFARPAYSNKRFVVKDTLHQLRTQRHRGEHHKRYTLNELAWRYQLADPLPSAAKWARPALAAVRHRSGR